MMKTNRIRIELSDKNCVTTPVNPNVANPFEPDPGTVVPIEPNLGLTSPAVPAADVSFTLMPEIPENYAFSRFAHPATEINITVPDDEVNLVKGWLGLSGTSGGTPSDTLVKRMTDKVTDAMKSFFTTADTANLFVSAFRISYAWRLANGKHCAHGEMKLIQTNAGAPKLLLRESGFSGSQLNTFTEIMNSPCRLSAKINAGDLQKLISAGVTHLDIYCSKPVSLLCGDEQVTSIRTTSYAGESCFSWFYDRMSESDMLTLAKNETDLRVIASVAVGNLDGGEKQIELPLDGSLTNWKSFPKLESDGGTPPGEGGGDEREEYTHVVRTTVPLRLGDLELRHKVRGLTVCGVFEREFIAAGQTSPTGGDDAIAVRLYGSQHRERWHLVARSRGPHLRLLRAASYRWWRVEIVSRREAQIEALIIYESQGT